MVSVEQRSLISLFLRVLSELIRILDDFKADPDISLHNAKKYMGQQCNSALSSRLFIHESVQTANIRLRQGFSWNTHFHGTTVKNFIKCQITFVLASITTRYACPLVKLYQCNLLFSRKIFLSIYHTYFIIVKFQITCVCGCYCPVIIHILFGNNSRSYPRASSRLLQLHLKFYVPFFSVLLSCSTTFRSSAFPSFCLPYLATRYRPYETRK